jgi:LytR cell envelope-related transcriptional attenuator
MSNNRHASEESYSRAAGGAALRGALILFLALVIGVFLVRTTSNRKPTTTTEGSTPAVVADSTAAAAGDTTADGAVPTPTSPAMRAPEIVKVLVANGSGVNRAAARVRAFLVPLRYDLPSPADATLKNYEDFVYFNPGFEVEAKDIAAKLGITKAPIPVPANVVKPPVPAFDVLVMVGPDLAVRYKTQPLTPGAAVAVTTTTAAAPASAQ